MLKCIDPATGDVIERICCDDRRTVHRTFRKLKEGQRQWNARSGDERAELLVEFARLLGDDGEEMVDWLVDEIGTPVRQARSEVRLARRRIEDFLRICADDAAPAAGSYTGADGRHVEREPYGVVAHISTWSFPCLVGVEVMVPALLAGNSVLYKPSEHASLTGRALVEMMWRAGLPDDVVDIVIGDGAVGDYVLDESVSGVFFTGAYPTGQMISQKLASRMIPQQMELGGKDGAYVCEDVDVDRAGRQVADLAFYNSGRGRRAFDRLYVHESVYRQFTDALCDRVDEYRLGDPHNEQNFVGPVVDSRRLTALEHQLGDAVRKGGRILMGGRTRRGKGNFFEPTVVVDVDHRMLVMREEACGPVLAVQQVSDDQEAVRRLQDTDYALTAGVFARNRNRARNVLEPLNARSVYWNSCRADAGCSTELPVGPVGVEMPIQREGLWRFTRPKSWVVGG